jgi:hypothetical protein
LKSATSVDPANRPSAEGSVAEEEDAGRRAHERRFRCAAPVRVRLAALARRDGALRTGFVRRGFVFSALLRGFFAAWRGFFAAWRTSLFRGGLRRGFVGAFAGAGWPAARASCRRFSTVTISESNDFVKEATPSISSFLVTSSM